MGKALDALLDLLDLEQIELDIFRGRSSDERRQRVFGGQVAGQALVAAGRTVPPDRPVHSLHAYFIRPGDPSVPLVYTVDRTRDGRSFTTRRVSAIQHGRTIFTLSASFHHAEPGPEHSDPMPEVPPPDLLERNSDRLAQILGEGHPRLFGSPFHHDESFSGRSRASRRCGEQRTGSAERSGIEAATRVRQLLVSLRVVAATGPG
jgi:acyl-CoA thioesterase II